MILINIDFSHTDIDDGTLGWFQDLSSVNQLNVGATPLRVTLKNPHKAGFLMGRTVNEYRSACDYLLAPGRKKLGMTDLILA